MWYIIKSMGSWRGILSLILVWLIISGSGLFILGFVIRNNWLKGLGITIYAFWLAPFTPLIPINIALALFMQRYILLDKSISWSRIKEAFKEVKKDDK